MCINPHIEIDRHNQTRKIYGCGKCYQCVRRRKLDWLIRLYSANNWSDCAFFKLLSYDEAHYPPDPFDKKFCKEQLSRFVKRVREYLKRNFGVVDFKYFIASEHGEKKDRLHYHALFFVKGRRFTWLEFNEILKREWPYGIVGNCYPITNREMTYVCKYIQKSYNFIMYSRFRMDDVAPYLRKWVENFDVLDEDRFPKIPIAGKLVPIPMYWMRLLYNKDGRTPVYRGAMERMIMKNNDDPYMYMKQHNFENQQLNDENFYRK